MQCIQKKIFIIIIKKLLQNNPYEFYETVKPYLINTNYEEFLASLNDIIWLNKELPEDVLNKLYNSNFRTKDIIK